MSRIRIPVDDPRQVGLERALGIRTKQHEFRVERFPKRGTLDCRRGKHDWDFEHPLNVAGELVYRCRKCGVQVFKRVLEHTLGKNEHQKAFKERNWLIEQRQLLLRKHILEHLARR